MPKVDLSFEHGQSWEAARSAFETGITQAAAHHRFWIRRVDWGDDRTTAALSGPGYHVTLTLDERAVHVTGSLPFSVQWLEGPVRRYITQNLGFDPPGKAKL